MDLDYDLIEYVRQFLPYKAFFDDILPRYDEDIEILGKYLKERTEELWIKINDYTAELIDFIDGNGFEVEFSIFQKYVIVRPIYPPEPKPVPGKWVSCETIIINSSVEESPQPIEKIYPPIPTKMVFENEKRVKIIWELVRPPPSFFI